MITHESFADKLRTFDVYRKIPKEYLHSSFIGALCKNIISYLFIYYKLFNLLIISFNNLY